ncbi:MAG: hypothetical protein JO110_05790, partial [Acetobacteraceae bacterium]|nr:hypothetical protein [Acetobacteraceae bacterium]
LEFFCLTPLLGSEDHQILWKSGTAMDPDLNKYDAEHVCTAHPRMSTEEWQAVYREAWSLYYTPEHIEAPMRRAAATGVPMRRLATVLLAFSMAVRLENVHPLQSGILRLKHPSERRPGLPRVNPWAFWPRFAWQTLRKQAVLGRAIWHFTQLKRAIECDPAARDYMDYALAPEYDDDESLDLLTKTSGPIAASVRTRPTMAGSSL